MRSSPAGRRQRSAQSLVGVVAWLLFLWLRRRRHHEALGSVRVRNAERRHVIHWMGVGGGGEIEVKEMRDTYD